MGGGDGLHDGVADAAGRRRGGRSSPDASDSFGAGFLSSQLHPSANTHVSTTDIRFMVPPLMLDAVGR